jgi:hypothetical protein
VKAGKDIHQLVKSMKPKIHVGNFVFCTVKELTQVDITDILFFFREEEAITIILKKEIAEKLHLEYPFIASWITLSVHSSLDTVGFTAAFSKALTNAGISCNVVAGYFHDHLFVDKKDAGKAMAVLNTFSED